jgi:Protein of unknown function (DUF1638)
MTSVCDSVEAAGILSGEGCASKYALCCIDSMDKKAVFFISCGIFKEELEYLIREKALDADILFLDAALHVNFDRLKERLVQALEEHRKEGTELKVLYGHCHPEIMRIVERFGAKKIDVTNCLEAIVGRTEIRTIDTEAKTFFLTAGWVNNWESMFALGKKDFNFDFSSMFSQYKRVVVFDTGVIPIDEARVEQFRKLTNLPVERRRVSLDHLLDLITCL